MEFSEKELAVIAAAKKKTTAATFVRVAIVVAMLFGIALMFADVVIADHVVYVSIAAVLLAVARPQLGGGPKYEDLVRLLEDKTRDQNAKT